jgi:hypothetical protein
VVSDVKAAWIGSGSGSRLEHPRFFTLQNPRIAMAARSGLTISSPSLKRHKIVGTAGSAVKRGRSLFV